MEKKPMRDYVAESAALVGPFRDSEAADIAYQIGYGGDSGDRKIPSQTRHVYRLPSFQADGDEHHAILKLYREVNVPFEKAAFEAHLFALGGWRMGVPRFALIPQFGLRYGIVMEDISGGVDEVTELMADYRLPFEEDPKYVAEKGKHLHEMFKTFSQVNMEAAMFLFNLKGSKEGLDTTLAGTSFVVHQGDEFKRIVCADVDQLFPYCVGYRTHPDLERLVV